VPIEFIPELCDVLSEEHMSKMVIKRTVIEFHQPAMLQVLNPA
jgi:hypothetical protein